MRRALSWIATGSGGPGGALPLNINGASPIWLARAVESLSGCSYATNSLEPSSGCSPSGCSLTAESVPASWGRDGARPDDVAPCTAGRLPDGQQSTYTGSFPPHSTLIHTADRPSSAACSAQLGCSTPSGPPGLSSHGPYSYSGPHPSAAAPSFPATQLTPPEPHLTLIGSTHQTSGHQTPAHGAPAPPSSTLLAPADPDPLAPALLLPGFSAAAGAVGAACTAAEPPSLLLELVQHVANSYEFVHSATGLPWVASIPLATLALRLALLPLSMRQARIIRSNFSLYREALALTERQERERAQQRERELRLQQLGEELLGKGRHQQQQQHHQPQLHTGASPSPCSEGERQRQQQQPRPQETLTQTQQQWEPAATGHGTAAPADAAAAAAAVAVAGPPGGGGLPSVLHARLLRSQAVLANYDMLRRKCDAPHPAWIVVNPLVQIPVFVLVSSTLGIMCRLPWPGLTSEGALWFPDLTQPALVMDTGALPMGPAGLALPLIIYGMTMTSLRLGFGASGLAGRQRLLQPRAPGEPPDGILPDTTLAAFLRSLAPLLYVLTTLNLYFKVQMAHGVLVHWLASATFTLSLQLALRNPALRALLKLPTKLPAAAASGSSSSSPSAADAPGDGSTSASSSSSFNGGQTIGSPAGERLDGGGGSTAALPRDLVARVAETSDANVLVVMGAQLSARHHYAGALHCFRKAVLVHPGHVRAHYSMGQVYALTGCWSDAELSYRAAAELAPPGPERGQALYCVATALHSQGKLDEAVGAYADADAHWPGQAVIAFGRTNALAAAGRLEAALAALAEAEARDAATPGRPFRPALARLRSQLGDQGSKGAGAGGVEGGVGEPGMGTGPGPG